MPHDSTKPVPLHVSDPSPATCERGPVSRLQWRHGVEVDAGLREVAMREDAPGRAWTGVLAETHATLLDPGGNKPLERPDPIASAVLGAMQASEHWAPLADAAKAHPVVARDAVRALADVAKKAMEDAGVKKDTDAQKALSDLEKAKKDLLAARVVKDKADASGTAQEKREALRKHIEAQAAEQRAQGSANAMHGMANRCRSAIGGEELGAMMQAAAKDATETATVALALDAALGDAVGVGGQRPIPDAIMRLITDKIAKVLQRVGALRPAVRAGRSARHIKGREGMIGMGTGGVDRIADLTVTALAGLGGHLGPTMKTLSLLDLAEGRSSVIEKGGGHAHEGHVVVVLDQSGSMEGVKEEWASAVAIVILLEARRENRRAAVVTYSGDVRASVVVDSQATLMQAILAICAGAGGGNNEHRALVEATRVIRSFPHSGDGADITMITDGQWELDNTAGVDLTGIAISACFIGGAAPEGSVGTLFKQTWSLASDGDLTDDAAISVARGVV